LKDWKASNRPASEFKFNSLNRGNLGAAMAFVEAAWSMSDIMGFKGCVVDTTKVKSRAVEEVVYQLHYELVMAGVEHEVGTGRVTLPRAIGLVKDGASSDPLWLPELKRRLSADCRAYFGVGVSVDDVAAGDSARSELLQLADLFVGSIARALNGGETRTVKDEFVEFFQKMAGFPFAKASDQDAVGDAVYVHWMGQRP
jgi:hypothetical protein